MMPATEALTLNVRWRLLYSLALLIGFLATGFGRAGWPQIITDAYPPLFSIPPVVVLVLIVGRLLAVWVRAELLTWPTGPGLHRLAKLSLAATVTAGVIAAVALAASTLYISTVPSDARGAVGLIVGIAVLPLMFVASLGIVLFEWTRGIAAVKSMLKTDRKLIVVSAIVGASLVIGISISQVLFPMGSLTRAHYDGVLPWVLFALGLGALIVTARRDDPFPASAVFATTLTAYVAATAVALSPPGMVARWGIGELAQGKGLIGNGVAFALVLAAVPVVVLTVLNWLSGGSSSSVAMRTVAAGVVAVPIAWLGIAFGTKALNPPPKYQRDRVLSDDQLSRQAASLQRRCAAAGIRVFRTQEAVSEIELRYPSEPPGSKPAVPLSVHPDASRPHHWFPRNAQHLWYERVVFAVEGQRRGYRPDPSQGGYGFVDSKDHFPRYVLTWKSLQTPQEEADGILGTEMTIFDTQDDSVLARQVLFFKRNNERFGLFQEACGTLNKGDLLDAHAYRWASTILIPRGVTGTP